VGFPMEGADIAEHGGELPRVPAAEGVGGVGGSAGVDGAVHSLIAFLSRRFSVRESRLKRSKAIFSASRIGNSSSSLVRK